MGYYGRGRYRSWRSRGRHVASKYSVLEKLFGNAVAEIRQAFLSFDDEEAIDEMFADYGEIYGDAAEKYARKTFSSWASGSTKLSGQTMERLVELVPPYLSSAQRFSILQSVLKRNRLSGGLRTIKINVKEPNQGFAELQEVLAAMSHNHMLANLSDKVMKAASWLYDDDITSARAMLAEAERMENDMIRSGAAKEIELLQRTISTGQVKAATYTVEMPAGKLHVVAYSPSMCFVATVCFGQNAPETTALRIWRDQYLIEKRWGRKFVVWYYNNGEVIADIAAHSPVLRRFAKTGIRLFIQAVMRKSILGAI
jgi:hypothetical protein